jgi:hypothetical protein
MAYNQVKGNSCSNERKCTTDYFAEVVEGNAAIP